ncbi:unnamed protein product [Prorocentrum cordatum]|uniref:Uncharacterized protein n=1 Tax=Prorocentrum cordatum TaxID=2364126 RepID=A0ABN9Q2E5_9DINO|nr:unnamed protein product [Polarella glacialis]
MRNLSVGEGGVAARVITPSSKTIGMDCRESADQFTAEYAATYRSMAPTALCMAHDRFEIQHAVVYLVRGKTAPTWHQWFLLQRLASYLEQRPQLEVFFEFQRASGFDIAFQDHPMPCRPCRSRSHATRTHVSVHALLPEKSGFRCREGN